MEKLVVKVNINPRKERQLKEDGLIINYKKADF